MKETIGLNPTERDVRRRTLAEEVRWMRCFMLIAVLLSASVASAQSSSGVFGGYAFAHPAFDDVHLSAGDSLNGWLGGVDVSITNHVGIVARVDGTYGEQFRQGLVIRPLGDAVRSALYTVTAGPRVSVTPHSGFAIFLDGLIGAAHGKAREMGVDFLGVVEDTRFVGGVGGGVGVRISRIVDLQVDVQYRRTNLFDQTLNVVQIGAGVILRPTRR
jgi:hypothetical protein